MGLFAVTIILIDEFDRILTVARKSNDNDINLPGGKIDPGETPIDALKREVEEETGFVIDIHRVTEIFRMIDSENHLCSTFVYETRLNSSEIKEGKPEGEGMVRWLHFDAVCAKTSTYREYNKKLKEELIFFGYLPKEG